MDGEVPDINEDEPYAEQRAFYEKKYGLVFLDDAWSVWHIRVWLNTRESAGMGITINASTVFKYAVKFDMDEIDTLERIKHIERGANSEKKT
ncbi:MAG: hypothetical protein DRI37_06375 [Chloroflexi bacterium]|nr:MAG: hypothetical protein DRI37_06375 [Chloroflexota bacterium]